jgi:hypothetical protein
MNFTVHPVSPSAKKKKKTKNKKNQNTQCGYEVMLLQKLIASKRVMPTDWCTG